MSRIFRRLQSSKAPSASSVAASFLSKAQAQPQPAATQLLDPNQLSRLHVTLNRPQDSPPPTSKSEVSSASQLHPVPPCHHLVYFTPDQFEEDLGRDGTDTSYNPEAPFTRRMWAGGSLTWEKTNLLRVGQIVEEKTKVLSAEAKKTKGGEEMVVVGVEKTFSNEGGLSVVDRRNWIFRHAITTAVPVPVKPITKPFPETVSGAHVRDFTQTPISLFRFSALTFNAHKIHYHREWCQEVEGHRDLVVHGPLNLLCMVDFWRDVIAGGEASMVPRSVHYRATSPLFAGEKYRIVLEEEREKVTEIRILDSYGNVGMTGRIERF